jgi:hypothetical protein
MRWRFDCNEKYVNSIRKCSAVTHAAMESESVVDAVRGFVSLAQAQTSSIHSSQEREQQQLSSAEIASELAEHHGERLWEIVASADNLSSTLQNAICAAVECVLVDGRSSPRKRELAIGVLANMIVNVKLARTRRVHLLSCVCIRTLTERRSFRQSS